MPNNFLKKLVNVSDLTEFKKYFYNTSWMFLEKIVRTIAALTVGTYVARYLGPTDFGILNYAISFVLIFSVLAHLNIESVIVRELSLSEFKKEEILGTSFGLRILGSSLAFFFIMIVLFLINQDSLSNLLILIISVGLLFQPFNVIDSFYQAQVLVKHVVTAQLIQIIVISFFKIYLVLNNASLISFAIVTTLESAILAIALISNYLRFNKQSMPRWRFNHKLAMRLLKYSIPMISGGIAVMLYMRLDQIMIKNMLGSQVLGNYSAAISLCESWYFIPLVICNSLFPAILDAKQKNTELYLARVQRLYNLMVKISLCIMILTIVFGGPIMHLFFGPAFEGEAVLKFYICGLVFTFLGVASGKWLLAEGHTKIIFYRTLCGLIVNVLLNFLLIPKFGILGATFAAVFTFFVVSYLYDFLHAETRISFIMKSKALLFIR